MKNLSEIKITECPRDAMQGIIPFIPTEVKIEYINSLLKVGFDTLDFGSFVSPKAIPQLKDTAEVVKKLDLSGSKTKLLAIVGNEKGAEKAVQFDEISFLGFPFSHSPTFMQLNLKTSFNEGLHTIEKIQNLCVKNKKELIVYFSMAFGNPYGDELTYKILKDSISQILKLDIGRISFADTVGIGQAEEIENTFLKLIKKFPHIDFGFHLHSSHDSYYQKVDAAYRAGCRRFDSVILGLGGCPMTAKKLVGNLNTEDLLDYLNKNKISHSLDLEYLKKATQKASEVFNF